MFPHMIYGGDYNPEQWSPDIWHEDAWLMQEAGVNLVSLGIFSWARLEPAPEEFTFGWLDDVMDLLHAHGVRVNLATPTASPPPWLATLHPDSLPVTAEGIKLWHGSRRHYCPHSPDYHSYANRIVTRLAERYREHPALAMWHVDNEYGCHVSECFCDTSTEAFRAWLRGRYGSLDALNAAWGTSFWSQYYGEWEEIIGPRRAPAQNNPTQRLDWLRFCSDSWVACFDAQKAILRTLTPDIPITTNFMSFFKPIDYWKFAAREDIVSHDSYPDPSDPDRVAKAGMVFDLMRSLGGGKPWLLMEQASSHVNWRTHNAPKAPGMMRLGSYQAVAHGADGVMFFQWRASKAGSERFHSGMVPHSGTDTRTWREVKALGNELRGLDALPGSRIKADVAIVFDWNNWWALEGDGKPSADVKMLPGVTGIYAELFRRNIAVDFVQPEGDLSPYQLVIAPNLYLASEQAAQNIEAHVSEGGTLLMTFFSGIVDQNDQVLVGGYPALFRKTLGLWVEDFAALAEGQTGSITASDGRQLGCELWRDVIRLDGAQALAGYTDGTLAGVPAVTRYQFGKGRSFYAGTQLGQDELAWLLDQALGEAGVKPVLDAPDGVEVTRRSDGTHDWLFVLNYSDQAVEVGLPGDGVDLISGAAVSGSIRLGPVEVAIMQIAGGSG